MNINMVGNSEGLSDQNQKRGLLAWPQNQPPSTNQDNIPMENEILTQSEINTSEDFIPQPRKPRQSSLFDPTRAAPVAPPAFSEIADSIHCLIKTHCVVTNEEAHAITLFIMASWVFDTFRIFPRLALISPEKRCGKSTLMEVISCVTNKSLMVSSATGAVISRLASKGAPTLMLDEADTFIKNAEPVVLGIINSGHCKATAKVLKCDGDNYDPKEFSTWMPVVMASIGVLADTIMDRSIVINLRRKNAREKVRRIPSDLAEQCAPICAQLAIWAETMPSVVAKNIVEPSDLGNDRARDNWLPLFSVARQLSFLWEKRCNNAYVAMTRPAPMDLSTQLLSDIRDHFKERQCDRIPSSELVRSLCGDTEKPWSAVASGKRLTPNVMASMLSPYGIIPSNHRFGEKVLRGYSLDQFADAFERYLS
jgi:hypothetical protein